jgi:hypothetical protein
MASSRRYTPVVVGVGDVINRSVQIEDAREPMDLMLSAIKTAVQDTCAASQSEFQSTIDSIDVVSTWTWPYSSLPGLISDRLGVSATHKYTSPHGGNQPAKLFDEAARRVSLGQTRVAVVTGGEALASCRRFQDDGRTLTDIIETDIDTASNNLRDEGPNSAARMDAGR